MPRRVFHELYTYKPGLSAILTSSARDAGTSRINAGQGRIKIIGHILHGIWEERIYVHPDENLEQTVIRYLKSLGVSDLSVLERSAAWVLELCDAYAKLRFLNGPSRAYGRFSGAKDAGEISAGTRISEGGTVDDEVQLDVEEEDEFWTSLWNLFMVLFPFHPF